MNQHNERAELIRELGIIERTEWQGFFPGSAAEHRKSIVRRAIAMLEARPAEQAKGKEAAAWEGADEWERLAWHLCAEENGEDACSELVWEGGLIPEPWGDRWLKYEPEAKRMIELVRKYTTPPAQPTREWVGLGACAEFPAKSAPEFLAGAYWAESKLREKNAGLPAAAPKPQDDLPAILKKQAS